MDEESEVIPKKEEKKPIGNPKAFPSRQTKADRGECRSLKGEGGREKVRGVNSTVRDPAPKEKRWVPAGCLEITGR